MKKNLFELKADGSVERVGGFGSHGPTINAKTKTEATQKFMAFAYRALEKSPTLKTRNGAWQLAYASLDGLTVEAGTGKRTQGLCISSVKTLAELTDETASFAYYASDEYRNA